MKAGYKKSEIGTIPSAWSVQPLGDLATKVSAGKSAVDRRLADFLVYGSTGVIGYTQNPDYQGDAILVARVGANAGKTNMVSGKYGVTDNTIILKLNKEIFLPYMFLQLESLCLNKLTFGSGQPLITGTQLKQVLVRVPIVDEQKAIASAIDDMTSLISLLNSIIQKKRDIKRAMGHQLLTGQYRLPGFSDVWRVKDLAALFTFSGGYSASRDQLSGNGHCYLHYGDIHGSLKATVDTEIDFRQIPRLDISLKSIPSKYLLEDGDVVFVDASEDDDGVCRHVVVINKQGLPFISGLHTIVAKSKNQDLTHSYLKYCFTTDAVRKQFLFYAVGTKVSGISKTNIAKISITVPSIPEQNAIAAVLSEMDAELMALELRREKMKALKKGMAYQLLTGKTRLAVQGGKDA